MNPLAAGLRCLLPAGLLFARAALPAAEPAEEGFRPLFDGRTLAGWVNVNCAPETWSVTNGMIHCDGVPTGALRTERQYENFILELEWRHLKPGGNAGVFVWAGPLPARGQPFLRSIEVQVLDTAYGKGDWFTTHGDVFPIHGSKMKPFPPSRGERSFPTEHRSKPSPEWNHYRITASNGVLRLAVNGREVSGGEQCVWRKGYIALESEGGIVHYRNLRLKELPSTGAPPEDTAPQAEPWHCLYDGRSLRGWQTTAGEHAWKPSDWNLRAGSNAPPLWAQRAAADFEFFCDWQWSTPPACPIPPVVLRQPGADSHVRLPEVESLKAREWHRVHLTRRGRTLAVSINGRAAAEIPVPEGELAPGLFPNGTETRYSSAFLR